MDESGECTALRGELIVHDDEWKRCVRAPCDW